MRILITSDIFPPDVGGPATYVPYVAEQLSQRGHRVTVLTYSVPRFHPVDSNYRFEVVRVSLSPPQWRRIPRTVSTIIAHGRRKDVIYANGLVTESVLANAILRKPIVAKVVGDLAWERSRDKGWIVDSFEDFQAKRYAFKVELLRWRRNFAYRHMLRIIVPSQYLKDTLVKYWALPAALITVIYNAFQVPAQDVPPAAVNLPVEHTIITVCRLTGWKGVDGLIRVLCELPDLGLIVVGDGPARADLVRLAQRLGVDERVHFAGTVAKERVSAYLRASDLFVLNSTYEGLPHVLLEAMAAGLPVIATNAGGSGEIVEQGHNGLLIPPRDAGGLQRALLRMMSSPAERMNMVRNGRDTLGKFNPEHMVEQTEALLLSTVGHTPA
jgi:glycosyltransferase involved in cell wall biosynthesis